MQYLIEYPLLLLFVVASTGYLIGQIKVGSYSLGVAAVLFTGLAFGAIEPELHLDEIILLLGLSVFVYSIGLSSGPAFFESYKQNGVRDFLFILFTMAISGSIAIGCFYLFDFSAATVTGVYSGSTTNTPALAGVINAIKNKNLATPDIGTSLVQESVVGYSFSYIMGVLGGIIAVVVMEKVLKIDYEKEKMALRNRFPVGEKLTSATVRVTQKAVTGVQLRDLFRAHDLNVVLGRIYREGKVTLSEWGTELNMEDRVMMVGAKPDLEKATHLIGEPEQSTLDGDRSKFDVRRIFVSNPEIAGRTIASLQINERYNAVISRIRRGDIDMLAKGDTVLELGDRVRFIARREDLETLSEYFGDSYQDSSTVNLFSFGLGIGLGLILGTIEIPIGGDINFKLGYAGGPLVVGLLLGAIRRTGRVVWTLPYSANVTLRQLGLIFLLSAIGIKSGSAFVSSFNTEGLWLFLASSIISLSTAFLTIFIGYKFIKIPFTILMGMVSNQPAILDFVTSRSGNKIPQVGYAMMFPISLILKILIAQLLFAMLG